MAHPSTAARLLRRVRGRIHRSEPDFGDHGTAFGLDLSLTDPEQVPAPAPSQTPAPRQPGFWRRLADRRGGSTD
jgi:hypothetical protein